MIGFLFVRFCVFMFKLYGWRIPKRFPADLHQYVLVVAPHTSNYDFPIGIAARYLLKLDVKYAAKKELFRFPFNATLRRLGGYPVDRSKNTSFVDQIVEQFNQPGHFSLCITPEGTRSKVTTWKTGFYHMAMKAGVPIMMVGFDYELRVVVVSDPFIPSGNMEADFELMDRFFEKITPRHPEKSKYHDTAQ